MNYHTFFFNELRTCCYVVWDPQTKDCILIDPGCYGAMEETRLTKFIADNALKPLYVVNTHCHFDHIMGLSFVLNTYQIPFYAHPDEANNLKRVASYASLFGFTVTDVPKSGLPLPADNTFTFGNQELTVLVTPGHSPGSICLYHPLDGVVFSGDTLFAGSVGRTDLPGGDYDALMASLTHTLMPLPPATCICPGHGPSSTLETERMHNPFLQHLS